MAEVRRTRQQKIQIRQRKTERQATVAANDVQPTPEVTILPIVSQTEATYTYAMEELHRIGWITLVCGGLLILAALFMSAMPMVEEVRQLLHLPHITIK